MCLFDGVSDCRLNFSIISRHNVPCRALLPKLFPNLFYTCINDDLFVDVTFRSSLQLSYITK